MKNFSFRKMLFLSMLAMLMVIAAACSSGSSTTEEENPSSGDSEKPAEESKDPIKIGVLASLSGG
ncbi:hypothetical protein NXY55_26240, partial [Aeromonas veronii]|nr:hypothetical protein [Aeromonas veronii]